MSKKSKRNIANYTGGIETDDGSTLYGMDAEHYLKMKAKEDPEYELKIRIWLEGILEERLEGPLHELLRDGIRLITILNKLQPGIIKSYNTTNLHIGIVQLENLKKYVDACYHIGLKTLFTPGDVIRGRGMTNVVNNLAELSRLSTTFGYKGEPVGRAPPPQPKKSVSKWATIDATPISTMVTDFDDDEVYEELQNAKRELYKITTQLDRSQMEVQYYKEKLQGNEPMLSITDVSPPEIRTNNDDELSLILAKHENEKNQIIKDYKQQIRDIKTEVIELKKEKLEKTKKEMELKKELISVQREMKKRTVHLNGSKKRVSELENELSEIETLRNQNQSLASQVLETETTIKNLQEEIDILKTITPSQNIDVDILHLRSDIEKGEREKSSLKREISLLHKRLDANGKDTRELVLENEEQLINEKNELKVENTMLREELIAVSDLSISLEEQIHQLQKERKTFQKNETDLTLENKSLKEQVEELQYRAFYSKSETPTVRIDDDKFDMFKENEILRLQLKQMEEENRNMTSSIGYLEAALKATKDETKRMLNISNILSEANETIEKMDESEKRIFYYNGDLDTPTIKILVHTLTLLLRGEMVEYETIENFKNLLLLDEGRRLLFYLIEEKLSKVKKVVLSDESFDQLMFIFIQGMETMNPVFPEDSIGLKKLLNFMPKLERFDMTTGNKNNLMFYLKHHPVWDSMSIWVDFFLEMAADKASRKVSFFETKDDRQKNSVASYLPLFLKDYFYGWGANGVLQVENFVDYLLEQSEITSKSKLKRIKTRVYQECKFTKEDISTLESLNITKDFIEIPTNQ